MVWDILLQAAAGFILGAAVGYGVGAVIDALSRVFAELWENLVAATREIWGYVTEATQYLLANIAQFLDNTWSEIEYYLRQEFGYRREWWIAVFREGREVFLGFIDPTSSQNQSVIGSIGMLEPGTDVQLPTKQNPIVTKLTLA
ncbi:MULTISPECIES: hypothetical protein [unclassified Microcoleus]|jgi:hypothetical protein|uniref:hypothetical protein n=1 Tax=unclassified Microcoleus TaxID=2642155 RepID=UPI001DB2F02F|nr:MULTISPECIES: hypothetical protein [unclassified Microcoleus]MCC3442623.1 hypothetical protein [Microcoleus sp. PH2017_03_ELD_O_A]MCC3502870.1 hypothetical protein [Microcoleus sp. PH2017_19_SFW_U_A]TAE14772.1 MAG: hypothetical protein EAZ94_06250 [Oscillatoriales cyanobacterium]MCC3410864.1 hypothetical protein [Microcoleus sp. PH2017_02_FOX_O_A]MCC3471027.1 hypothetical protein [Microcoleus sp. PH2017_13_LAR_U_A]